MGITGTGEDFLTNMIQLGTGAKDKRYNMNFYRFDFGRHKIFIKIDIMYLPKEINKYIKVGAHNIVDIYYDGRDKHSMEDAFYKYGGVI